MVVRAWSTGDAWAHRWVSLTASHGWLEPLALGVLTAALGFYGIADKSIGLDEAYSLRIAREPIGEFLRDVIANLEIAMHLLLLKAWLVFGEGEAALRSLSVVSAVVAVLATYAVGRRFGVAFAAALLLAVSPTFVQYAQEARHYTLFAAWSGLSTLALLRLLEHRSPARVAAYVLLGASMVYVHLLGALVIAAHVFWIAARKPPSRRLWLGVFAVVAICWLPMVPFVLANRSQIDWIQPTTSGYAAEQLILLAGGPVLAGAALVLLATGARRDLTMLWLAVPILGTLLISILVQPVLLAKYLIGALPAAAVMIARNRVLAVAVVVLLSLAATFNWYAHGRRPDWRAAAAWVTSAAADGDGIVFASPWTRLPFAYYARVADPIYPPHPWSDPYQSSEGEALPTEHPRVWLVLGHGQIAPEAVWNALDSYDVVETRTYGGPEVRLLMRRASATAVTGQLVMGR